MRPSYGTKVFDKVVSLIAEPRTVRVHYRGSVDLMIGRNVGRLYVRIQESLEVGTRHDHYEARTVWLPGGTPAVTTT